jgi:hypothetical protein
MRVDRGGKVPGSSGSSQVPQRVHQGGKDDQGEGQGAHGGILAEGMKFSESEKNPADKLA